MTCDIVSIEKVQRRFTKRLPGLKNFTYQERLNRLNLVSLELLRLHMDLIVCYKMVFVLVSVHCTNFLQLGPSSHTGGHAYKLCKQRSNQHWHNIFWQTSYLFNVWNRLSQDTVHFTSLNKFKSLSSLISLAVV